MFERLKTILFGSRRQTTNYDDGFSTSNHSWFANQSEHGFDSSLPAPHDMTSRECNPSTDAGSNFDAPACDSGFDGGGGDSGGGGASGDS
jgi:uncharacterized membrane protein YgcG